MEKITIEIEGNSDDLMEVDNLINLLSELKKTTKEKLVFEKIEAGSAIATANILDETQKKQLTNYFNFQPEPSIDNFKKYSPKADRDRKSFLEKVVESKGQSIKVHIELDDSKQTTQEIFSKSSDEIPKMIDKLDSNLAMFEKIKKEKNIIYDKEEVFFGELNGIDHNKKIDYFHITLGEEKIETSEEVYLKLNGRCKEHVLLLCKAIYQNNKPQKSTRRVVDFLIPIKKENREIIHKRVAFNDKFTPYTIEKKEISIVETFKISFGLNGNYINVEVYKFIDDFYSEFKNFRSRGDSVSSSISELINTMYDKYFSYLHAEEKLDEFATEELNLLISLLGDNYGL